MPQAVAPTRTEPTTHHLPVQQRAAQLEPASFNEADSTVDCVWTTGARVRRYDWFNDTQYEEELVVTDEAVDMSRFEAGVLQVLDGHQTYGGVQGILGIATRGSIVNGEGRATLKLSQRPELAGVVSDIKAGVIRAISFGYAVRRYEITPASQREDGVNLPLYRAVLWQPQEISFVTVPADANAGTRSQPTQGGMPCEFIRAAAHIQKEPTMTEAELQAQRDQEAATRAAAEAAQRSAAEAAQTAAAAAAQARAAEITEVCTRHGVANLAAGLIRSGGTLEVANRAVLEALAQRDAATGGHRNVRIETLTDEFQTRLVGIEEAIHSRVDASVKLTDNGRQYRGMSLLELGREILEVRGINTRGMTRMALATQMLTFRSPGMQTTSDFANLFSNVASKRLRAAYAQEPSSYTMWARRAPNAPDFKNMTVVSLSGAPELLKVNEHGEFKYGTLTDGAETYHHLTYGRIVAITRQAIINDDLRAFDRLVTAFGDSAARLENRVVYAELTNNAALSDTVALFHATHGNLQTGGGSVLSLTSLGIARAAMRTKLGLAGEQLNVLPKFLIVPAALEGLAYQLTSPNYVPATQAGINEFAAGGRTALTVVVEPLLDAVSTTAWYLASSSGSVDTVEYVFLDGEEGPVIETEAGFEIDGTSWKCREDFAAKAVDYRGLYKSNGA